MHLVPCILNLLFWVYAMQYTICLSGRTWCALVVQPGSWNYSLSRVLSCRLRSVMKHFLILFKHMLLTHTTLWLIFNLWVLGSGRNLAVANLKKKKNLIPLVFLVVVLPEDYERFCRLLAGICKSMSKTVCSDTCPIECQTSYL